MVQRALVALQLPPGPELPAALAAARDGGPAVLPLSPALPAAEVDRLLAELRPARLVRPGAVVELPDPLPVDDAVALVVATSGSTGRPKGVVLTWAALAASARAGLDRVRGWEGRWLCCLPLSSVGGLQVLVRAGLAGTEPVVLERFSVAAVAGAEAQHVSLVPTMLDRLLAAGVDLTRFRTVLLGGAPASPGLLARAHAAGVPVVVTYGMTETAGGCVYDGVPLDDVEAAIGADGRIRLRGPVLADGYRTAAGTLPLPLDPPANPAGTDASARGAKCDRSVGDGQGWFVTGDLGHIRDDGRLEVLGRADDVILTGGQNVAAGRVAALVAEHPAVAEAAVVGRPDPDWGERVVAVIVPRGRAPDLPALRAFLRDRAAPHELPRELVITDRLPLLPNGKPDRLALRQGQTFSDSTTTVR